MANEMIERVARAIYEADDAWSAVFAWPEMPPSRDQSADEYRRIARAAIEAMKDPDFNMLGAMFEAMFDEKFDGSQAPMVGAGFDAAIEAALEGKEGE